LNFLIRQYLPSIVRFRLLSAARKKIFEANFCRRGSLDTARNKIAAANPTSRIFPSEGRRGSLDSVLNRQNRTYVIPSVSPTSITAINDDNQRTFDDMQLPRFHKMSHNVAQTIVLDNKPDCWNREVHGGLKMWVNERTSEVSIENSSFHQSHSVKKQKTVRGTASVLYNQHEVDELFDILDIQPLSRKLNSLN
jgi:hypothetical protein